MSFFRYVRKCITIIFSAFEKKRKIRSGSIKNTSLFWQAESIAKGFLSILKENEFLNNSFVANKDEIEKKYKVKIAKLNLKRTQRVSVATAQNQSAQINIQDALNALAKAETKI